MARENTAGGRRSFRRGLLLTVATLGLYGLWWNLQAHREVHEAFDLGRKGRPLRRGLWALGLLVPPVFWLYQRRFVKNLNAVRGHLDLPRDVTPREFLVWEVLGALVLVGPVLAHYKLQRSVNEVWDRHEEIQARPADLGTGARDAVI